jgi:four helix bundle protein
MDKEELKRRTKQYALRIVKLIKALPKNMAGKVIGNQLLRSGTSVGSNYRAACRARSKIEFIAKLGIVIEEADESAFWIELIIEAQLLKQELMEPLLKETKEILAIMIASANSASRNK